MQLMKILTLSLVLSTLLAACAIGPSIYESKPIEGWVVDSEAGKPVEGAVVMARWEMSRQGQRLQGDNYTPKVIETLTDAAGHFTIPGWGPGPICCGWLTENDPQIFIFKPGYTSIIKSDSLYAVNSDPRVRTHEIFNGVKFEIKPYQGDYTGDEGAKDFDNFMRFANVVNFGFLIRPEDRCGWRKIPNLLRALLQQSDLFEEHGYSESDSITNILIAQDKEYTELYGCQSPKNFIEGHDK